MKNISKIKKLFLLIFCFFSIYSSIACAKIANKNNITKNQEEINLFKDEEDFYKEIYSIQKRMDALFEARRKIIEKRFSQNDSGNQASYKTKIFDLSNENYYIYSIEFSGYKKDDIIVSLKNNELAFYAKSTNKNIDKNNHSSFESHANFYYSFYLHDIDSDTKPEISRLDKKISVTIKKPDLKMSQNP